jgi:error-prone DNA polymerase
VFAGFGVSRRAGLWAAGGLRDARAGTLPGIVTGVEAPPLPGMTEIETTAADLGATGLSAARHPTEFVRGELAAAGVVTAETLRRRPDRARVEVAGVVTHRQQPETAKGVVFLNLEDETGLVNVICTPDVWERYRRVARTAPALRVRGRLEREQGVVNLLAQHLEPLALTPAALLRSRDFR